MAEYTYPSMKKLRPYIAFFYYSDGHSPPIGKERVLPSGSAQLIINLGADHFQHFKQAEDPIGIKSDAAIIAGVNSRYIFLDPRTRRCTIGAVLKPGSTQVLFDLPTIAFTDQAVSLDNIITIDSKALRDQLIATTLPQAKLNLLESFLVKQLNISDQPNAAILRAARYIKNNQGCESVSKLADTVGYSRRRFTALFQDIVGITPKRYARIQRFQHALRTIRSHSIPDWNRTALSCGYYDQPHFNRDFKALAGLTPSRYFCYKTREKNHLPA